MIALTGAYYGLVGVVVAMFALSTDGATRESINDEVFPSEPALENQAPDYRIANALEQVRELSPDGELIYMIVHDANSENRFMEFYLRQPGLLAWSENYRFDTAGNYLGTAGYTEGAPAQQILYSVYRVHFGNFAGLFTKLLYVILGMSLTIVSATGINIWLEKRKYRDGLNLIWPGIVWGMPLAVVVASTTQVIFHLPSAAIFWGGMVVAMTAGLFIRDEIIYRRYLKLMTAAALLILVIVYCIRFGSAALSPAGLSLSLPLLAIALALYFTANGVSRKIEAVKLVAEEA